MESLREVIARKRQAATDALAAEEQRIAEEQRLKEQAEAETEQAMLPVRQVLESLTAEVREQRAGWLAVRQTTIPKTTGVTIRVDLNSKVINISMDHSNREQVRIEGYGFQEGGLQFQAIDTEILNVAIKEWAADIVIAAAQNQ